ncbi:MAG: hypothetical protein AAF745_14330 [Planctomycetota bacterium]
MVPTTRPWPTRSVEYGSYFWLMQEVGRSLNLPADINLWGHADVQRVDSIVQSGYMQFCIAPSLDERPESEESKSAEVQKDKRRRKPHTWSFLNQVSLLQVTSGQYRYDLPEDFAGSMSDLVIETGQGRLPIVSERHLQSLISSS